MFLVGFMGAGKSSVGVALARMLGWPFEDLDQRIEARTKRSIEQIFRDSGEAEFRRLEHAALQELLSGGIGRRVVALGGGAFIQPENAALLGQDGLRTVFLDAPVDELYRRSNQEGVQRPLRQDKAQFERLYHARRPQYLKAGLHIATAEKTIEAVAERIVQELNLG